MIRLNTAELSLETSDNENYLYSTTGVLRMPYGASQDSLREYFSSVQLTSATSGKTISLDNIELSKQPTYNPEDAFNIICEYEKRLYVHDRVERIAEDYAAWGTPRIMLISLSLRLVAHQSMRDTEFGIWIR